MANGAWGGGGNVNLVEGDHVNPKYVTMFRGEIMGDSLAPTIITPNIKSETGEYLKPEAGTIILKVIVKPPESFSRLDSGLYTTDAMQKIVTNNAPRNMYAPTISDLYKPLLNYNEIQFIMNTRVFGVTTIKGFSDYERNIPTVNVPVIIDGRLEIDYGSSKDSSLKIPPNEFVYGDELEQLQKHVRLEVFLLMIPGFGMRVLVTQYYDIHQYFLTQQGDEFLSTLTNVLPTRPPPQHAGFVRSSFKAKECAYVKLGYHWDDRPQKRVVEVGNDGARYLQKFIFKPSEWHFYTEIIQGAPKTGIPVSLLERSIFAAPFRRKQLQIPTLSITNPWYAAQIR